MGKHTDEWNDLNDAEQSKRGYTLAEKLDAIDEIHNKYRTNEMTYQDYKKAYNSIMYSDPPEEVKLSEETFNQINSKSEGMYTDTIQKDQRGPMIQMLESFLNHDVKAFVERHMENKNA